MMLIVAFTICKLSDVFAQPTDNPIATFYGNSTYSNEGYPNWTDDIKWENVINVKTYDYSGCSGCTNDFAKFEYVRDILYAQGGGVMYYPAGVYNFSDHPTGPDGRGVMLKKGVVIRGEAPANNEKKWAINNWSDKSDDSGLSDLKTEFVFPTWDKKTNYLDEFMVVAGNGLVPRTWNHIGLQPVKENGESIKDVNYVGICWVKLKFATVFFGGDFGWADVTATWATAGAWKSGEAKTTNEYGHNWSERVADGTHPFDVYTGSKAGGFYKHGSKCRMVFGCRFENSVVHDDMWKHGFDANSAQNGYFGSRFLGRVVLDGENIFVANNVIPKPTESFYFIMYIKLISGAKSLETVAYDYARSIGFDVNKSLNGQRGNRCILTGPDKGPYYCDNVIMQDNYTWQHGNKGYEGAGKWSVFRRNIRTGHQLLAAYGSSISDDVYGFGTAFNNNKGWRNTLNGYAECKPTDDNMDRGMDMAGWNLWIDGNHCENQKSWPGNDGEGILWQRMNTVEVFSVAVTNNSQGFPGSYVYPYDCHVLGMIQSGNTGFSIGNYCKAGDRQEDFSAVANDRTITSACTGGDAADMMFDQDCTGPANGAPSNFSVVYDNERKCNIITWTDNATNEYGFSVERREIGATDWTVIAIRSRNETGGESGLNNPDGWIYP